VAPFDVFAPELELWREGLVDLLSRNFDGAGSLHTVPAKLAIRRWSGRADPSDAQTLGRRTGARLVVYGQLVGSGRDSVRLRATLLDARDGRRIAETDLRDLSAHMDRLAESGTVALLRALGRERPLGAVRRTSFGGASLPALKEFLRGEQFFRRALWDSALAHYDAAIALDSSFALAYRRITYTLGWDPTEGGLYRPPNFYALRAAALNRGLTPRDSLLIVVDSLYYEFRAPEEDTAFFAHRRRLIAAAEQAVELYPGDPEAWNELGEIRFHTGFPPSAAQPRTLEALDRAIQLDPDYAPAYEHIVQVSVAQGKIDLARARAEAFLRVVAPGTHQWAHLQAAVLDPARSQSAETARLIDSASAGALYKAAFHLIPWPDSGEGTLRLVRGLLSRRRDRFASPPAVGDSLSRVADSLRRRYFLAHAFGFRGHVREARSTWPVWPSWLSDLRSGVCMDLAVIDVLPADSVSAALKPVRMEDPLWGLGCGVRMAPSWWYTMRDSAELVRFQQRMKPVARSQSNPIARVSLQYLVDAAGAYLVLSRSDSAKALRMFAALPDSLCEHIVADCFYEKLTQARLSAALGQPQAAASLYDRWLSLHYWSPLFVLGRLERARLAERLGDPATAAGHYHFVLDAWRTADPELQPYVAEARTALGRLSAERP
jgi:serine/threonine-protein kinase